MATQEGDSTDHTVLFRQLDDYDWAADQEFQGGLAAILGSVQDAHQADHLTLRAKCYYFARKAATPVDFDGYKRWVEQNDASGQQDSDQQDGSGNADQQQNADKQQNTDQQQNGGGMGDAPKPASFAEICDMIAEGKPIPGIKDIPDTILEGHASETHAETRKKPWETTAAVDDKPSWMTE